MAARWSAGTITAGMHLDLVYNAGSSEWRAVSIGSLASVAPSNVSFSAYLPAGSFVMASATPYLIPFNTVSWNFGSLFNGAPGNYLWTPPAGRCSLSAAYYATGQTAANYQMIMIYKNGARRFANQVYPAAAAGSVALTVIETCNGTDYFQVVGQAISAAGATLSSDNSLTYFIGSMI